MTEQQAVQLFKCLADATRLQMLKMLQEAPSYVELMAQRLDRTPSTVSFHLKKLEEAGLVESHKEQYYVVYSLKKDALSARIIDIICEKSQETDVQQEREAQYRKKVLDTFIQHGKLISIPVQRKKKRIILERIAQCFEQGRIYPEKQVNLIIADFHDDFCTIRRDLISEGIMERDYQGYWLKESGQTSPMEEKKQE